VRFAINTFHWTMVLFIAMGSFLLVGPSETTALEYEDEPNIESDSMPEVVEFERISSTHVRVEWSNGVVFSGTPGSKVTMGERKSADGIETEGWIRIQPPEISGPEHMKQAAIEYQSSNRSPATDLTRLLEEDTDGSNGLEAIDVESSGTVYDSGCTSTSPTDPVYVYGCYQRYVTSDSDPSNYYSADKSQVTGNTTGNNHFLTMIRTDHWYSPQTTVVGWEPAQVDSVGNCVQRTYGLSGYGVQMSETINLCPEQLRPSVYGSRFHVDWEGDVPSDTTRASTALNHVSTPIGYGDTFALQLDWNSYRCTGFCP
jgi:hypothetical protein